MVEVAVKIVQMVPICNTKGQLFNTVREPAEHNIRVAGTHILVTDVIQITMCLNKNCFYVETACHDWRNR